MPDKVLSACATCKHANWKKTTNGRRHPDGTGRCTFEFPDGPLPKWMVTEAFNRRETITTLRGFLSQRAPGSWIYWVEAHRTVAEGCATWEQK